MKYISAFIHEVLRADTNFPIIGRKAVETCKLGDYIIPKGTDVMMNVYSANMDKTFWGDPEIFRPERFIDGNGENVNLEKIASFGFGKRNCIGLPVAKNSVFLTLAYMLQNFTFLPDPKTGVPNSDLEVKFATTATIFNVVIKQR